MLNRIRTILGPVLLTSFVLFVLTKGCVYTAITAFLILSSIGLSPIYCVGEVDGSDINHAWVRIGSYDIEQSTLNIHHYEAVDYDAPVVTFNTTSEFVDRMDMLHPLKSLM